MIAGGDGAGTGGIEAEVGLYRVVGLVCPLGIVSGENFIVDEGLVFPVVQMPDADGCHHCPFYAFGMIVGRGGSGCCQLDALFFIASQPPRCRASHGTAVAHRGIRFMIMVLHPEFKAGAKTGMAVLVGTHPEIRRHVKIMDKSLGTGKGQHCVVGEMRTRRKHLYGIIVLGSVRSPFVSAAGKIADSGTHQ